MIIDDSDCKLVIDYSFLQTPLDILAGFFCSVERGSRGVELAWRGARVAWSSRGVELA